MICDSAAENQRQVLLAGSEKWMFPKLILDEAAYREQLEP